MSWRRRGRGDTWVCTRTTLHCPNTSLLHARDPRNPSSPTAAPPLGLCDFAVFSWIMQRSDFSPPASMQQHHQRAQAAQSAWRPTAGLRPQGEVFAIGGSLTGGEKSRSPAPGPNAMCHQLSRVAKTTTNINFLYTPRHPHPPPENTESDF